MYRIKKWTIPLAILAFLFFCGTQGKAQQKDPDYLKLTAIDYQTGDIDEAMRLLKVLEQKYPDNPYILTERGGWQLYGDGDVNAALISLSKAVKLLPKDDNLLTLRGIAFYRKGLTEKAIEDQQAAIAINPSPLQFYIKLGGYQYALKQYELALETFLKAVNRKPAAAEPYGEAFAAYAALNKTEEPAKLFEKGLAQPGMDIGFLRCHYGDYLMRMQRFAESAAQYQLAYDMPEPHLYAKDYHQAALSYYKTRNLQKAIFFLDIALKKSPQNVDFLNNRTSMAMDAKDWNQVIALSARALAVQETNALANMYMAIGLKWGPKDLEKSAAYERRANELDKNNPTP